MTANSDKSILVWKAVAFGAALVYLYKVAKSQGGSLQGNPYGVNLNGERVVDFASQFVSPEKRHYVKKFGQEILRRL